MPSANTLKEFVKPPFANYDIVVYFGCGLFSLPLIYHYFIEPLGFRFPRFEFAIGIPFADAAISTLSLLFSVYVLGHIIAFAASLFIEKAIDAYFGKVSSAILISTWARHRSRNELVNAWIYHRWKEAFRSGRRTQNLLRVLAHLPVIPLYLIILSLGGFDYYRSRVPRKLMVKATKRMRELELGTIGLHHPWYKVLEHEVINNYAVTTSRMYNYLVISGTFRSLSLLFLACLWCEFYYLIHFWVDGDYPVKALMYDGQSATARLFSFALLYVVYGFSISSYMKFSRRYAEEAIFAFVLARPN